MQKNIILLCFAWFSLPVLADVNIEEGKQLAAQGCASCHGVDGIASNPNWPNLAGQNQRYLEKQLQDYQTGARKGKSMEALAKRLTAQNITDISAYFSSLPVKDISKTDSDKKGSEIYIKGIPDKGASACAACHGPSGEGLAGPGFPALKGQHSAYIEKQMKAYRDSANGDDGRSNDQNRIMQKIAKDMDNSEIRAVADYVQGMK